MEKFNPADRIQDLQYFGEFGGVNPSISDSSTYTFLSAKTMFDTFEGNAEGCYLYSRHSSPSNLYLDKALAAMEGTESANVSASGMGAITPTLLQLCGNGDHIVSSRTIYGGTYAFLKNFTPRFGVKTTFVDITKLDQIENAITNRTKLVYCESISNPMLEVADLRLDGPAAAGAQAKVEIPELRLTLAGRTGADGRVRLSAPALTGEIGVGTDQPEHRKEQRRAARPKAEPHGIGNAAHRCLVRHAEVVEHIGKQRSDHRARADEGGLHRVTGGVLVLAQHIAHKCTKWLH